MIYRISSYIHQLEYLTLICFRPLRHRVEFRALYPGRAAEDVLPEALLDGAIVHHHGSWHRGEGMTDRDC